MKSVGKYSMGTDLELILTRFRVEKIKYYRMGNEVNIFGLSTGKLAEVEILVDENDYLKAIEICEESLEISKGNKIKWLFRQDKFIVFFFYIIWR